MSVRSLFFGTTRRIVVSIIALTFFLAIAAGFFLQSHKQRYDVTLRQKISSSSALRLSFPALMDHASLEKNTILPKDLDAVSSWDGDQWVLQPKAKLPEGSSFHITVPAVTLTAAGNVLGQDLHYTFTVSGAPMLAARIPAPDTQNVGVDADIALIFDRPVVPLSQVQGAYAMNAFPNWPVEISSGISGTWRWLGTTTASFTPSKPLTIATLYTVTVPAGIKTVSGDSTVQDFSWSFETERPRVLNINPAEGSKSAGATTVMTIAFNQDMDLTSARKSISILETEKGADILKNSGAVLKSAKSMQISSIVYGKTFDESGKEITDKKTLIVRPSSLKYASSYVVAVRAGMRGLIGDLGTQSDVTSMFQTVDDFAVINAGLSDLIMGIDFTAPVLSGALLKAMQFTPSVTGAIEVPNSYEVSPGVHRIQFYPPLSAGTTYLFSLKKSLTDLFGRTLKQDFNVKVITPDLAPSAFIYPRGNSFSIFEREKEPIYYINGVNIKDIHVSIGALSIESLRKVTVGTIPVYRQQSIDLKALSDDIHDWHIQPTAKRNHWQSIGFDLQKKFGSLKPGLYAMTIDSPEWKDDLGKPLQDFRVFSITNLGITLKYSGSKALAWVTDLKTGNPVKGATIKLLALSNRKTIEGMTDENGFFETPITIADMKNQSYDNQPLFLVTAEKDDDKAFIGSDWNRGFEPYAFRNVYSDFRSPERSQYRLQSAIYTDRPLYRTGDTVHFKGLVRLLDWNGKSSIPDLRHRSINVLINDAEGRQVYEKTLKISSFGSFDAELPISLDGSLGYYSIQGTMLPEGDVEGQAYGSFSVLAYRKPEYTIGLTPEKDEVKAGEKVTALLYSQYYFGAPMSSAKVHWRVDAGNYYFSKFTDEGYSFAVDSPACELGDACSVTAPLSEGNDVLDAAGKLSIKFAADISSKPMSQILTIQADVTDQNNQVVSGAASVVVHKSDVYVGIKSVEYAVQAGGKTAMKIITLKPDGTPAPSKKVELKLYARTWNTISQKGVDGEYYYDSRFEDTFISSQTLQTDASGKAMKDIELKKGGEYNIIAVAKDAAGIESKAGTILYAWSDAYFNWPRTNNDRIDIVTDKDNYRIGDTAHLIVKSPYQGKGVKALVTVERENVMTKRIVDVTSNAVPIDVPITEDLIPTAYVSVIIVKPRIGETFDEKNIDTGGPAFKIGYAHLPIDISSKRLTVSIKTDKKKYLPRETVKVDLQALSSAGKPVKAELFLAVVDMSLLDLMGFSLPDPAAQFYYERGLGVVTANMFTYLMERFKPGSKGGGGGGDDQARGIFKDTAYWNPTIHTDSNGHASLSFTLPDNLTTWNLLALGATEDGRFGAQSEKIIESKQVIVRSVRPRFGVTGDEAILGAIVHNYLPEKHTFKVRFSGNGFTLKGKAEQSIEIAPDERQKILFPVTIVDTTGALLNFSASTDGARDEIIERIPVFPFGTDQTVATAGVTEDEQTEQARVPTLADAPTGKLSILLSPSLAVYLGKALTYLDTYSYGCSEQTMSAILPAIAFTALQGFDQFHIVSKEILSKKVLSGLQTIYASQRSDGGFAYWPSSSQSYPSLTAYILHGFKIARDAGYSVDESVISRAVDYLSSAVRGNRDSNGFMIDDATRAYIAFALGEYGTKDPALLSTLVKAKAGLPLYAKAYLAMALQSAGMKDKASILLNEVLSTVKIDARGAHFEEGEDARFFDAMNTDATTTALVLQAILRVDPKNVLAPRIVRGMLESRHEGHWDTTQSTAQSILALVSYLQFTKELDFDFKAQVAVGEEKILDRTFKKKLTIESVAVGFEKLRRGSTEDIKVGKSGKGKLYYDLVMSYFYTPDIIEPTEQGIGILREMTPFSKADTTLKVGTTQKIRLTITVPETRHFVAVESMLPAGFEPIDLQYAISEQSLADGLNAGSGPMDYYRNQSWRFSHTELRDDRVFLFAEELPPGVYRYEYLIRATTPGKFRQRPAKVFEMYHPENFGQTDGGWITIAQ